MIINLGCAAVDNHIPRDDIFDYHPHRECNIYIIFWPFRNIGFCRCPSLSCPLDSLPPGGQANRGWLAPRGASCPRISCPPSWLSSPPGGKLSRPVYLAPRPTQVKIYICYFVIFLYHFNDFRSSISHKVRNWCLRG